jgi:hypothetical protein
MSDWCLEQFYADETIIWQGDYRNQDTSGTPVQESGASYIYGYTINLDNAKTLNSLKLPPIRNVVVLALDLKQ